MIKKILRALIVGVPKQTTESKRPSNRTMYRWRCACGAKSRYSDIKSDTEYNAERHRMRPGNFDHAPEVYPTDEE